MGAISFSINENLVKRLVEETKASVFIETGTFKGDSLNQVLPFFQELHTAEVSSELYSLAARRFKDDHKVTCHLGSSEKALQKILPQVSGKGVIFWLDAHWCEHDLVEHENSQCNLINELRVIKKIDSKSVILVDDARYFLAPPPAPHDARTWPSLDQVIKELYNLSADHSLMVYNDNLIFLPKGVQNKMQRFFQKNCFNLLAAVDKSSDYDKILLQAQEKEIVIQNLAQANEAKNQTIEKLLYQKQEDQNHVQASFSREIEGKQKAIEDLSAQIKAWRMVGFVLLPLQKIILFVIKIKKKLTRVRLGVLHQYRPRRPRKSWLAEGARTPRSPPTISLVTPSFNQAPFIEETIKSVVDQDYPCLEYFIQDGGSSDETVNILRKLSARLSGWTSSKDQGQAHAINQAFSRTSGEIMGWLNSDDLHFPHTLRQIGDYFQNHPEVDVLYGNRLIINEAGQEIGKWILPKHQDNILSWADYVPQETLFWRRRIWDKAGGQLDPALEFALDWDLLVRFRQAGARIRHLDVFLACFRVHADQKTSLYLSGRGQQEMDLIRYRIHGRIPEQKEIWGQLKKYLRKSVHSHNAWMLQRHCFHILTMGVVKQARKKQLLMSARASIKTLNPQAGAGTLGNQETAEKNISKDLL